MRARITSGSSRHASEMLDAAKRHIGELSMEIELLRERARAAEHGDAEVATMRDDLRGEGRCFGIQRRSGSARAALYARRARAHHRLGAGPARRGPVRQSDELLAAIRADLARSPFHGEGHRKVHAGFGSWMGPRRPHAGAAMRAHGLLHRGVRAPRRPTTGGWRPT